MYTLSNGPNVLPPPLLSVLFLLWGLSSSLPGPLSCLGPTYTCSPSIVPYSTPSYTSRAPYSASHTPHAHPPPHPTPTATISASALPAPVVVMGAPPPTLTKSPSLHFFIFYFYFIFCDISGFLSGLESPRAHNNARRGEVSSGSFPLGVAMCC